MLVEDLKNRFVLEKERNPLHENELLDYMQKLYIYGMVTIVDYKIILFELEKSGAKKPESFTEKTEQYEFEKVN